VKVLAGLGLGAALFLLFENTASSQFGGFRAGPLQKPQSGPLNNGSLQPGFIFGFPPTPNPMFGNNGNQGNGGNNGGGQNGFGGGQGGFGGGQGGFGGGQGGFGGGQGGFGGGAGGFGGGGLGGGGFGGGGFGGGGGGGNSGLTITGQIPPNVF